MAKCCRSAECLSQSRCAPPGGSVGGGSGVEVRNGLAFQAGDLILDQELAFFQPFQFEFIDQRVFRQAGNHVVQIAVFDAQLDQPTLVVFYVICLHRRDPPKESAVVDADAGLRRSVFIDGV